MKTRIIAAALLLCLPLVAAQKTTSPKTRKATKKETTRPLSANQILQQADDARAPDGDVSFRVRVKDYDGAKLLRPPQLYKVFAKGDRFALIETLSPQRLKGRKILLNDDTLFLYLPSVGRPTPVSLQQRLTGEVANGDIARTRFFDDYKATIARTESIAGRVHYVLELMARSPAITYRKVHLWVDKKSLRPTKAHFYAVSGMLLKTSQYSNYRPSLGRVRANKVIIRDAVNPRNQSHLEYSSFKREKLDESFFAKDALS